MNRRPGSCPRCPTWRLPALILLAAGVLLLAGGYLLGRHFLDGQDGPYRALSGWLLLGAAAGQSWIAWLVWQRKTVLDLRLFRIGSPYWRWFLIGPVVCFLVILSVGPERDGGHLFFATLALWCTGVIVPLVARGRLGHWADARVPRLLGNILFGVAMLGVAAELGLRSVAGVRGEWFDMNRVTRKHAPPPPTPGGFRIAVIGDEMTLSGPATTSFLARLQRRLLGVEVHNFGVARAGPREYVATLTRDVLPYQPDLVLTLVSVGDDVSGCRRFPGYFDWQGLHLVQLFHQCSATMTLAQDIPHSAPLRDREAYLDAAAERLAVCRSPVTERRRAQWRAAYAQLDQLLAACRSRNIPAMLAIVPSEVQLDARLRTTLCRRLGYAPGEITFDLPQRKLAEYARDRSILTIDLLPHFRLARDRLYGHNDHRFNARGHQLTARVIGDCLQSRFAPRLAQAAEGRRLR